jgi:hypothetical protein
VRHSEAPARSARAKNRPVFAGCEPFEASRTFTGPQGSRLQAPALNGIPRTAGVLGSWPAAASAEQFYSGREALSRGLRQRIVRREEAVQRGNRPA